MNVKRIAALIPAEYRKEMLDLEMIDKAIPNNTDGSMHYLCVVWKDYIEPGFDPSCNLCYARVLNNLKKIKHVLVELEKESRLLNNA